jgi:DNA-directed RNA polymerase subunit omega
MTEETNLEQTELNEELNAEETVEEREIPEVDSKYRLILLAAQRSKQLQKGAVPKINADVRKTKATRIALEEINQRKVDFELIDNS